ncbi:alpha/beta fold hydrolase [Pseudolabrys sp. FHR47]|uniref:alpha/beta fold hydrolase n=1 Tax=Pseudolabrys sp. FHR47 TaxID=2562284 RepID=UPI0010BEE3F2|nr:alpha/beta fold hydrolase [Pseudolabrys sp. FHR47]
MSETNTFTRGGVSIRYRIDGRNGAPWIMFSNSICTDLSLWDDQAAALAADFRVLRYDQRGQGGSSVPSAPCNFDQLGGDVAALLDHLGIDRCTFVGLSMGVPTGLDLYAKHPQRIERLVLCDGQAATAPAGAAGWEERIEMARRDGMEAFADATVARWFSSDQVKEGRADCVRKMIATTPFAGFEACARALQNYAYVDVLPRITAPTLLIVGKDDGRIPETMARMRDAIAGSRLVEIAGAGHIPNIAQPEQFNRALDAFLFS